MKIIKDDRFCPSCGSTIIQGENDGCNGPRSYTCEICGYSKYRAFPPTFPKRLKVKSREFAILYLQSEYTQSFNEVALEAIKMFLVDETIKEVKP